jgi:cytochrome c oxidase subunit 2
MKRKTADSLYVPVNKAIKLNLLLWMLAMFFTSLHSELKKMFTQIKKNCMAEIRKWEGDIVCAEYCGLNHSYMYNKINVLSEKILMNG